MLQRKELLRKKYKRHYLCSNQKLASTQTIGSAFLERVRKVQNSKYEHDLLKVIDCLIDGFGFVKKDHIIFSKKNFDNPSIFPHMFTKLPKISKKKKNSPLSKKLQKTFQTCKKDVIFLLIFKKLQKTFQFF